MPMDESDFRLERTMANREEGAWIIEDIDDLEAMLERKNVIKLVMDINLDDPSCLKEVALQIKEITFRGLMIKNIDYIRLLVNLEEFSITDTDVERIIGLNELPSLKWVNIYDNPNLTLLDSEIQLANIETMIITFNSKLRLFPQLITPKLTRLRIIGSYPPVAGYRVHDLLDRIDAPLLEDIDLSNIGFNDLAGLNRFEKLKRVHIDSYRLGS